MNKNRVTNNCHDIRVHTDHTLPKPAPMLEEECRASLYRSKQRSKCSYNTREAGECTCGLDANSTVVIVVVVLVGGTRGGGLGGGCGGGLGGLLGGVEGAERLDLEGFGGGEDLEVETRVSTRSEAARAREER